ncbi:hypothetical protein MY3296_001316 [Beauveria thailandica]
MSGMLPMASGTHTLTDPGPPSGVFGRKQDCQRPEKAEMSGWNNWTEIRRSK